MADLTVIEVPVGTLERLVSAIEALERRMQGAVKQPEAETGLLSYDQVAARLGKNGLTPARAEGARLASRPPRPPPSFCAPRSP